MGSLWLNSSIRPVIGLKWGKYGVGISIVSGNERGAMLVKY
jgi:hypothetical protein